MPTQIDRLIIFGDSLSDIGHKRTQPMGQIAALLGLMRTNQVNRYSDNRNWTDFIWEWAGGAPLIMTDKATSEALTAKHLSWSVECSHGAPVGSAPFYYANYAEGGAMGGSDRSKIGLGTFREQADRYLADLPQAPPRNFALYLVWFGLNDLVTNGRDPADMKPVADEMVAICQQIRERDPHSFFLFGNLPNPQGAVRFLGQEATELVRGYQTGSFEPGFELATTLAAHFPHTGSVVDIYTKMDHVNSNLAAYGLQPGAQPHGVPVRYGAPPTAVSYFTYTSDEAHPTEEVYRLIAKIWTEAILSQYDLGTLRGHPEASFPILGQG